MKKSFILGLLLVAGMVLKGTCVYAQEAQGGQTISTDKYAWRLDGMVSTYDKKLVSDYGDLIYSGSLVRFFYTDSSFSVVRYPQVDRIADTIEVSNRISKTDYDQLGPDGKHREKVYNLRLHKGGNKVRFIDSIPQIDPFKDTVIAAMEYKDYAYDTYRNVYDEEGNLLRQIRNYDYTRHYMDYDSLDKFLEDYKESGEFPIAEFNKLPYETYDRNVLIQTDSSSTEMRFLNTAVYSYLPAVWELQSPIRTEQYKDHILSMKSEINIKPYNKKPSRVTKSTRYNKYGVQTGTYELTERWTEDSVPTYYAMKDVTNLGGDSVLEIKESRAWPVDAEGEQHSKITREQRLYDSSINQTLYAKKTITTDGIEKIYNEEKWEIETAAGVKKAHLLYKDELSPKIHWINIQVQGPEGLYHHTIGYDTVYLEKHQWYRYDERYNILLAGDSAQVEVPYTDSVEWEGTKYSYKRYSPKWGTYSLKEYVYADDNSVVDEKEYTHGFIDTWYLTKEKLVTDEYTWTMSVNTKDSTRTTSKKYSNGWDSESATEKFDISSMKWEITESSKYVVTFDMTGEPVSAISATTQNNNTKTDRDYYLFHRWDEDEQRYVCQRVAWSMYDTADIYSKETIHPYDCEDYTYYDREGNYLGYFVNCVSHYLPITHVNVNGIYNKRHYDAQGRIDTLYRYAFCGEWKLVRYFVYEYFPEEDGKAVIAKRHSYSLADTWTDYGIDSDDPTQSNYSSWRYSNLGVDWHNRLSGADTIHAPLHEMRLVGTKTYSHTFKTYNEDGWLLETRTYNDGSMTPVTQIHNAFTYDAEGRVAVHVAYKDSVPDTKKIYFYSEQTGECVAAITWSGYNKETEVWSQFAFANSGEHISDNEGRLVTLTNYAASADSTGIVPTEQYEYLYESGEKDWFLSYRSVWQEQEWVCAAPTYRGNKLKQYMFDEDGNIVSRTARQVSCEGLSDTETWSFSYASPLSQYSLLSPQAYHVAEQQIAAMFTNEDWLSRPLEAHYTSVAAAGELNYTLQFHYTALNEEPVQFHAPVEVEPEEETALFTWPKVDGAAGYSLTIWADEAHTTKLCTILFDAHGTVLEIDFSHMPARFAAEQTSVPSVAFWQTEFNHVVEGLEPGTTYWYKLVALDEENHVLDTREASFRTLGVNKSEGLTDVQGDDVQCTKVLRNGQIIIRRCDAEYTIQGNKIK